MGNKVPRRAQDAKEHHVQHQNAHEFTGLKLRRLMNSLEIFTGAGGLAKGLESAI